MLRVQEQESGQRSPAWGEQSESRNVHTQVEYGPHGVNIRVGSQEPARRRCIRPIEGVSKQAGALLFCATLNTKEVAQEVATGRSARRVREDKKKNWVIL